MCLTVSWNKENYEREAKTYKKRLKRYPYAWKTIYVCHNTRKIFSQYGLMELGTNCWGRWMKSSRRNSALTNRERYDRQIGYGFHVYTSRKAAREKAMGNEIVVKVKVDPKTFIAIGRANGNGQFSSSAVFDKIMYLRDQKPKIRRK